MDRGRIAAAGLLLAVAAALARRVGQAQNLWGVRASVTLELRG